MSWTVAGLLVACMPLAAALGLVAGLYIFVRLKYLGNILRIFQERPLFIIPRGDPVRQAEDVTFPTAGGLWLRGCYWKTTARDRKGVILFGVEYGSNRWSCRPYCEALIAAGYDVFAFEPRNQGDSPKTPGYDPLQWITAHELNDTRAAIRYLEARPDSDTKGVGFFGISKGANAGLLAAADDPAVRCVATDGAFGTFSTVVPYMRKWVAIYDRRYLTHGIMPLWFWNSVATMAVRKVQRQRGVRYVHIEKPMTRLKQPLLMIHGEADTYIKPAIARELYKRAAGPKEFWVVPGAKHNQALHVAGAEYRRRVVDFFDRHLGGLEATMVGGDTPPDFPVAAPVPVGVPMEEVAS